MSSLDNRILELLKEYMGKLFHKKVLTSMEEVEANTNENNLVAAPVIAELNNKLSGLDSLRLAYMQASGTTNNSGMATINIINNIKAKAVFITDRLGEYRTVFDARLVSSGEQIALYSYNAGENAVNKNTAFSIDILILY